MKYQPAGSSAGYRGVSMPWGVLGGCQGSALWLLWGSEWIIACCCAVARGFRMVAMAELRSLVSGGFCLCCVRVKSVEYVSEVK